MEKVDQPSEERTKDETQDEQHVVETSEGAIAVQDNDTDSVQQTSVVDVDLTSNFDKSEKSIMKDLEKDSKTNPKSTSKKSKPKKYEKTENVFVCVSCFITKIV